MYIYNELGSLETDRHVFEEWLLDGKNLYDAYWDENNPAILNERLKELKNRRFFTKDDTFNFIIARIQALLNASLMNLDISFLKIADYWIRVIVYYNPNPVEKRTIITRVKGLVKRKKNSQSKMEIRLPDGDSHIKLYASSQEIYKKYEKIFKEGINYVWKKKCAAYIKKLGRETSTVYKRVNWSILNQNRPEFRMYSAVSDVRDHLMEETLDNTFYRYEIVLKINHLVNNVEFIPSSEETVIRLNKEEVVKNLAQYSKEKKIKYMRRLEETPFSTPRESTDTFTRTNSDMSKIRSQIFYEEEPEDDFVRKFPLVEDQTLITDALEHLDLSPSACSLKRRSQLLLSQHPNSPQKVKKFQTIHKDEGSKIIGKASRSSSRGVLYVSRQSNRISITVERSKVKREFARFVKEKSSDKGNEKIDPQGKEKVNYKRKGKEKEHCREKGKEKEENYKKTGKEKEQEPELYGAAFCYEWGILDLGN